MKFNLWGYPALVLCTVLSIVSSAPAQGKVMPVQSLKALSTEKSVSEAVRQKRLTRAPVIIGPIDRSTAGLLAPAGDPCATASPIYFGQSISAKLESTDCRLDDGSYADFYTFDGLQGEQIDLRMAGYFDSYLGVANESGTWVIEDDDGGGYPHARITATLPESGTYIVLANSAFADEFGDYNLSLSGGPACSYTFSPASGEISADGGTFTFDVTTGPRCYWSAGSGEYWVITKSAGLGSGTVTYTAQANPVNQKRSVLIWLGNTYFVVNQAPKVCNYTLSPESVNLGSLASSGSFTVTAPQGCFWSATGVYSSFITANSSANGNGTVNYSVTQNNGAQRSGTVRIIEQQFITAKEFTINQAGMNCTYSAGPVQHNAPATGYTATVTVNTQPGCTWSFYNSSTWLSVTPAGPKVGPGTLTITAPPQIQRSSRWAGFSINWSVDGTSSGQSIYVDQAGRLTATTADFDGDSMTDISIYRPTGGEWWTLSSMNGSNRGAQFGAPGDIITPGDFSGDGKTDYAFFRPSNGYWYILRSQDYSFYGFPFGSAGDIPAPADFDGDGKTDAAVFRPSAGAWYVMNSSDFSVTSMQFGSAGDVPLPADYDGDAKADFAIYRNGEWWVQKSTGGVFAAQFGGPGDIPAPGDFTGDGKVDCVFFRPSNGYWYVLKSEQPSFYGFPFGTNGDIPAVGDYDGDGIADPAVFRPSNAGWYIRRSYNGFIKTATFGTAGDVPIPKYSSRQ